MSSPRLFLILQLEFTKKRVLGYWNRYITIAFAQELHIRGVNHSRLVPVPLIYKGYVLNKDYVIDLLIEDSIVIELKAVEGILPVHEAQIISYLKLSKKRLGFPINFNVPLLKEGFRRFVNNF
jgi:GxxExxY protein